ncbi:MAG: DNA topoisomerase VI subunit B [Candidatus Thorarchaeota archaeon]
MTEQGQSELDFRSISPAEFFYRNRQMAGFGNPTQAVYSALRELVENGLDACEGSHRVPEIDVGIEGIDSDTLKITVSDNGTGLPYHQVPEAFGRVLYGSKYGQKQKRGTFGLGVTMAILYAQITTDSPVHVHTQNPSGPGRAYSLFIDVEKNQPVIESEREQHRNSDGTTVALNLRGDLSRAKDRVVEYLRFTTISSPYAKIRYSIEQNPVEVIGGWIKTIPEEPRISKPHPRAADIELLRRMMANRKSKKIHDFLVESFQQMGERTTKRFLQFASIDPSTKLSSLSRGEIKRLSISLRHFDGVGRPDSKCLSPIDEESFLTAVRMLFNTSWSTYTKRGPVEWEGNPFLIEGVIATADEFPQSEQPTVYRFANRVPLLYDATDDVITKVLKKINWGRYRAGKHNLSAALFIHFCSTKVPYRAAGKQSLAHRTEIENEVKALLRTLGRSLRKQAGRQDRAQRDSRRMREYSDMFRLIAKYGSALVDVDAPPATAQMVRDLFEVNPHA